MTYKEFFENLVKNVVLKLNKTHQLKIYDWPGLGLYAVEAILNSDYNAIMGFTLITGALFIIINLIVDIIQGVIDPRS